MKKTIKAKASKKCTNVIEGVTVRVRDALSNLLLCDLWVWLCLFLLKVCFLICLPLFPLPTVALVPRRRTIMCWSLHIPPSFTFILFSANSNCLPFLLFFGFYEYWFAQNVFVLPTINKLSNCICTSHRIFSTNVSWNNLQVLFKCNHYHSECILTFSY